LRTVGTTGIKYLLVSSRLCRLCWCVGLTLKLIALVGGGTRRAHWNWWIANYFATTGHSGALAADWCLGNGLAAAGALAAAAAVAAAADGGGGGQCFVAHVLIQWAKPLETDTQTQTHKQRILCLTIARG
jgi:hypothetical protein